MCKDKGFINCRFICKHKGACADCPTFRPKASCAFCGGTHYKNDMVLLLIDGKERYGCETCASEKLATMQQKREQANEARC